MKNNSNEQLKFAVNTINEVYIYGAGSTGKDVYNHVKNIYNVKGYLDSDTTKWGTEINGIPIIGGIDSIIKLDYDQIIIASLPGMDVIRNMLLEKGVSAEKINVEYIITQVQARLNFLHDFANIRQDDVRDYAVAEGGVFQGEFAKEINASFPNSTLYLFDTFEGFNARDTSIDDVKGYSDSKSGHLANTSEELVMSKLPHPQKAVILKGYFPETAKGLEDKKFFFVNLDFDLYQPILEGLRFFYPRLASKGVILIHDFFTPAYHGVSQAIMDFENELGQELVKFPIGDHCSIAIMKTG